MLKRKLKMGHFVYRGHDETDEFLEPVSKL